MKSARSRYHGHGFPPEIIGYDRDVEDLLAERGIIVSYETIRQWCWKFEPDYAGRLMKKQGRLGDSGRAFRQNQRPAALSVACRGSGW